LKLGETLGNTLTVIELQDEISVQAFFCRGPKKEEWGLYDFIKSAIPSIEEPFTDDEMCGCPKAIILSRSAIECGEIIRSLKANSLPGQIIKLFAKHIKVKEQQTNLDKSQTKIVVGTPHRVAALADFGNLVLDGCECIFIDMSLDQKNFCFFDIADVKKSFFNFYNKHIHERTKGGKIKIALF